VTFPPVADSMAPHRVAGTGRCPLIHWLTKLGFTPTARASLVCPPRISTAFSIGDIAVPQICFPPEYKHCLVSCKALQAAWLNKKHAEKITQDVAGEALGMSGGGFSQYINGRVAMGLPAQICFNLF